MNQETAGSTAAVTSASEFACMIRVFRDDSHMSCCKSFLQRGLRCCVSLAEKFVHVDEMDADAQHGLWGHGGMWAMLESMS